MKKGRKFGRSSGVGSRGGAPKAGVPKGGAPEGWGAQHFVLLPSPATIFILSSSLGGFVEFWWCF